MSLSHDLNHYSTRSFIIMTLHELNILPQNKLKEELFKCCGSSAWVSKMLPFFPAEDLVELLEDAEQQWYNCNEEDWKEAFAHHPKIGDAGSLKNKFSPGSWELNEQSAINTASEQTLRALSESNKKYEEKFGYIFIVCATGKSTEEMLGILEIRLQNKPEDEIKIAMEEQNMITKIRLEKLLS